MTLESPFDCKEIQIVHLKEISSGCSLESLMFKLKLWPSSAKNWLIWKDPDAGKDWRQEKQTTVDEMFRWHYRLNGHATAAKSLQSCPTLRSHRWHPTRLPYPWDSPGKNTGVGCHFLLQCMKVKSENEVAQSYLTLQDPMDWSPPGSSVHGIFQARILEWGAIAFFKWTWVYVNSGSWWWTWSPGVL